MNDDTASDTPQLVTLVFPDLKSLVDFTIISGIDKYDVIRSQFTLKAYLNLHDIHVAKISFHAEIV